MSSIKKNLGYQIAYQILVSILPFITSPYISRVLGAECIGIYAYTYSIVYYFKIFATLGITNYGNRLIAKSRSSQKEVDKAFSSLYALHFMLSVFIIILYIIFIILFPIKNKIISLIQSIYLIAELMDVSWFFFGMEKFKLTVTRNALVKILTAISIFVFVKTGTDLWKYVLILALGTLFGNASMWFFLPKYVKRYKFSIKDVLVHIKPMLVLFLSVIALSIYNIMDKIMIGAMSSMEQLGYYENAYKLIEFPEGFILALGSVMLPKMSYLIANGNTKDFQNYFSKSLRFSFILSSVIACGVASIAKDFSIIFWGKNFAECGNIIIIMSFAIIAKAFSDIIRTHYLLPKERDKVYLTAVSIGAIINVILNLLLIPKYGAAGAGFATLVTSVIVSVIYIIDARKLIDFKNTFITSLPYIIISVLMILIVNYINVFINLSILRIVVKVLTGMIFWGILCLSYALITKDKLILENIEKIFKRKN